MKSNIFVLKRKKFLTFFKNNVYVKEHRSFQCIKTRKMTKVINVAKRLKCTSKTLINNWKLYCKVDNITFCKHKGLSNKNALIYDDNFRQQVIDEYLKFDDIGKLGDLSIAFTISHFLQYSETQCSDSTKRRILSSKILGYYAKRKTKRAWSKKHNEMSDDERINILINNAANNEHKKNNIKEILPFGQIVEIDATEEYWFPTSHSDKDKLTKATLHGAIDSSGFLLSAFMDWEETNKGYIGLLDHMLVDFGSPAMIKADKRTSFQYNGFNNTVLGRSITSLGIDLRCESYGQFKPNIERAWWSIQVWLKKHAAILGIKTYDELFEYVNSGRLVKDYNEHFKKKPNLSKGNVFKNLTRCEINAAFVSWENRTVHEGNFFKIRNQYYYPVNSLGQRVVLSENKKHSTFKMYTNLLENKMFIKVHNQKLYLKIANYSKDYLDRDKLLKSLESDTESIIFNQENIIRENESKINMLYSMIYNSSDDKLKSQLEDLLVTH